MKPVSLSLSLSLFATLAMALAASAAASSPDTSASGGSGAWADGNAGRAEAHRVDPVDDARVGADRVRGCIAAGREARREAEAATRRGILVAACIRGERPSVR